MKTSLFIGAALLTAGVVCAQQAQMSHPVVSIERTEIEPIRREDIFSDVRPAEIQALNFDDVNSNFNQPAVEPRHMDFGGGQNSITSTDFQHNDHRSDFSNIRMQFEDSRFEHLNFNVQ
jgi:hypothetical protein